MINYQRLFDVYRRMAESFDAYYRTLTYHRQIKGIKRLEKTLAEKERNSKIK